MEKSDGDESSCTASFLRNQALQYVANHAGLKEEIFAARREINRVARDVAPDIAPYLPKDTDTTTNTPSRPSVPRSSGVRAKLVHAPLKSEAVVRQEFVEGEIRRWQLGAREESTTRFQSVFSWARSALLELRADDVNDKDAPSTFFVHATLSIVETLLSRVCADVDVCNGVLGALRKCLFVPGGAPELGSFAAADVLRNAVCKSPTDSQDGGEENQSQPPTRVTRLPSTETPWATLALRQDEVLSQLVVRVKSSASAIVALRGLLRSVFRREDGRRLRTSFTAWRSLLQTKSDWHERLVTAACSYRTRRALAVHFRSWARVVSLINRTKIFRMKDEAVSAAKSLERRLKDAVAAGREEVVRELEKVKVQLSEERGHRERQYQSFTAEMQSLTDRLGSLCVLLEHTQHHKKLWRSLWLTHHRETQLPQLVGGALVEEGTKLRDALRLHITSLRTSAVNQRFPEDVVVVGSSSEPSTPIDANQLGSGIEHQRTKSAARSRVEAVLIAWVNEVLIKLNVQRFLIAIRDDLADGVILAALCFALDRTKGPADVFVEENIRKLPPSAVGRRVVGALKQAMRRQATVPFSLPLLHHCPSLLEHLTDERNVVVAAGDDSWYLWVLTALFVDFAHQQVFPEVDDKCTRGSDSLQFVVQHPNGRSELYAPEVVEDAAEVVSAPSMRHALGAEALSRPLHPKALHQGLSASSSKPSVSNMMRPAKPQQASMLSVSNTTRTSAFLPVGGFGKGEQSTSLTPNAPPPPIKRKVAPGGVTPNVKGMLPLSHGPTGVLTPDVRDRVSPTDSIVSPPPEEAGGSPVDAQKKATPTHATPLWNGPDFLLDTEPQTAFLLRFAGHTRGQFESTGVGNVVEEYLTVHTGREPSTKMEGPGLGTFEPFSRLVSEAPNSVVEYEQVSQGGGNNLNGPYDALICDAVWRESARRKLLWLDVSRLLISAVVTYGVLERQW